MVFDTEFLCVLSGSCTDLKVDGKKGWCQTIGEDYIYINANLDGRVNTKILHRLEDEGASEKNIRPLRPMLEEVAHK